MKHRISKVLDCYSTYFIIEYKFLFWWITNKKSELVGNRLIRLEERFETLKEAKDKVEILECRGHRIKEVVAVYKN